MCIPRFELGLQTGDDSVHALILFTPGLCAALVEIFNFDSDGRVVPM